MLQCIQCAHLATVSLGDLPVSKLRLTDIDLKTALMKKPIQRQLDELALQTLTKSCRCYFSYLGSTIIDRVLLGPTWGWVVTWDLSLQ